MLAELFSKGVKVVTIRPGQTQTEMWENQVSWNLLQYRKRPVLVIVKLLVM